MMAFCYAEFDDNNQVFYESSSDYYEVWYTFDDDKLTNGHNLKLCSIVSHHNNKKNGDINWFMNE